MKSIGCGAFQFCSVLGNLALPESLRTIGASAFHNCAADLRVTLPISVISVYGGSFNGVTEKYLDGEKRFLDRVAFANPTQFKDKTKDRGRFLVLNE